MKYFTIQNIQILFSHQYLKKRIYNIFKYPVSFTLITHSTRYNPKSSTQNESPSNSTSKTTILKHTHTNSTHTPNIKPTQSRPKEDIVPPNVRIRYYEWNYKLTRQIERYVYFMSRRRQERPTSPTMATVDRRLDSRTKSDPARGRPSSCTYQSVGVRKCGSIV